MSELFALGRARVGFAKHQIEFDRAPRNDAIGFSSFLYARFNSPKQVLNRIARPRHFGNAGPFSREISEPLVLVGVIQQGDNILNIERIVRADPEP
jgi:hypothetical protein